MRRRDLSTGLLPAVTLGAALIGDAGVGVALATPSEESLEKEIVVTATRLQDEALAAAVTRALQEQPLIFTEHISVTAEKGIVRLTGVVQDLPELYAILKAARGIAGTRRVVNEIDYQPIDDDSN